MAHKRKIKFVPTFILIEKLNYARYYGRKQTHHFEVDRPLLGMEVEAFRQSPSMFYESCGFSDTEPFFDPPGAA